jgi:DDE superfamily endonuclease
MLTRRIGKESDMLRFPAAAEPLVSAFSVAFTRPTFQRMLVLILGAILSLRHRTVTGMLRAVGPLAKGHWSDFHRVLCRRVWSCRMLGNVLAAMVLELIPANQAVICPVDDTTQQHKGKHVYGKGCHHDACRSTHSHIVWVWGHKWVVLSINVKFAFASRAWALPVLCALYRPAELNSSQGRRHKTPIDLARQLMAMLIHWFPERKFILLGDGAYASHELARFCHRHRRHVTLVSRFHPHANLYEAPSLNHRNKTGRPRTKGQRIAKPAGAVKNSKARRFTVNWYGGKTRHVGLIWGEGYWYKAADGLVPVRWVFAHDRSGTHRDEYFYSTDPTMPPDRIVSLYTGRWCIEVTFQEVRAHLGFATPRNWSAKSVLRTAPCLLGLFSVVSLIFNRQTRGQGTRPASFAWYAKTEPTFTEAMKCVRRLCWTEVFQQSPKHAGLAKLSRPLRIMLLDRLSHPA